MGCAKYRVVIFSVFIFLSSCRSGVDHTLLETPEGVFSKVSGKNENEYSPYALAYYRAINDRLAPAQPIFLLNKKLKEIFEAIEGQKALCSLDESVLNEMAHIIEKLETTSGFDLPSHLFLIETLTAVLEANKIFEHINENLRICSAGGSDFVVLANKWEKALRSRLMLEIHHIRCAVLSPIGYYADKMHISSIRARSSTYSGTDARISARHIKTLIEFLSKAHECHEVDINFLEGLGIAIKGLKKELEDLFTWPATEIADQNKLSKAHQILMPIAGLLYEEHFPNLHILHDALVALNIPENEYLSKIPEPLFFHEDSLYFEKSDSVELIQEQLEDGKKFITFTFPEEQDASIFAEYFALLNYEVFSLDLEKLRKNAHALRLNSVQFIEWAERIIDKHTKKYPHAIVFLTGIGALNYDTFIHDKSSRLDAMAHNFDLLVNKCSKHTIIAPLTRQHEFLYRKSHAAHSTRILLSPLNLELSDKIIDYMIEDRNRREEEGFSSRKHPYVIMAKIARSFGEEEYYLSRLMFLSAQFDQHRVEQKIFDKDGENKLAIRIAKDALQIKQKKINGSRVLRLGSAPIEWRLLHSKEELLHKKISFSKSELSRQIEEIFRTQRERDRLRAERVRVKNELDRQKHENQRIILENARLDAEALRVQAEEQRVLAEAAMRVLLGNYQDLQRWQQNVSGVIQTLQNHMVISNTNLANAFSRVVALEHQVNLVQSGQIQRIKNLSEKIVEVVNEMLEETFFLQSVFNQGRQSRWTELLNDLVELMNRP
ncbi:MAG: hypothetical protein BWZ03_00281 [bacterium ADurb.BinA186]|nr:MAG: hypothetical protein BWZ03_00281 [bacterium ADurb.BinA186]